MSIYLLLYLIFLLLVLSEKKIGPKVGQQLFVAGCTVLFLLASLRYKTGLDYVSYHYHLKNASMANTLMEPVFGLIMIINQILGLHFQLFFAVIAALSVYLLYRFISRVTNDPGIKFFILTIYFSKYFLIGGLGFIRQEIAALLCCLAIFDYYQNKRKFYFLILLAAGFHYSALSLLLVPIFLMVKAKTLFLVLIGALVFGATALPSIMVDYLYNIYYDSIPGLERIFKYLVQRNSSNGLITFSTLERVGFLTFGWFVLLKTNLLEKKDRLRFEMWLRVYASSVFLYFIFVADSHIAGRISWITRRADIVLVVSLIGLLGRTHLKIVARGLVVVCYAYFIYKITILSDPKYGGKVYIPYKSIFNQM